MTLGPSTEARFAAAFAEAALLTRKAAAQLLGLDEKTLDRLSDDKVIRAVRKGAHRAYTEHDLRAYLIEGPDVECVDKPQQKAASVRAARVVPFSQLTARKRR